MSTETKMDYELSLRSLSRHEIKDDLTAIRVNLEYAPEREMTFDELQHPSQDDLDCMAGEVYLNLFEICFLHLLNNEYFYFL